jgi:hypothetical protein
MIMKAKSLTSFSALTVAALFCTSAMSQQNRPFDGYLKRDVNIFGGTEILRMGEQISCEISDDGKKCCFEDQAGTACVNIDDVSRKKVSKRDVSIASVSVNQSFSANKTACEDGIDPNEKSDAFIWSYGVRLQPTVNGRVLIRVSHVAHRGPLTYSLAGMSKIWVGQIDAKCHPFNFTKDNIKLFLNDYKKSGLFLSPSVDSNLDVEVLVEVFSEFEEENYSNNIKKIKTQIPVDGVGSWPPDSIGQ